MYPKLVTVLLLVAAVAEARQLVSSPVVFQRVGDSVDTMAYSAYLSGISITVERNRTEVLALTPFPPTRLWRARRRVILTFLGASRRARILSSDPEPSASNFYLGLDPTRWQTGVLGYQAVIIKNLYEGIDLRYRVVGSDIEYDFILSPGSNPAQIREGISGDRVSVTASGDLICGPLIQRRPTVYQEVGREKRRIAGEFYLSSSNIVTFRLGSYDRSASLVIDPVLAFASYLGGTRADYGIAVAPVTLISGIIAAIIGQYPVALGLQSSGSGNYDGLGDLLGAVCRGAAVVVLIAVAIVRRHRYPPVVLVCAVLPSREEAFEV